MLLHSIFSIITEIICHMRIIVKCSPVWASLIVLFVYTHDSDGFPDLIYVLLAFYLLRITHDSYIRRIDRTRRLDQVLPFVSFLCAFHRRRLLVIFALYLKRAMWCYEFLWLWFCFWHERLRVFYDYVNSSSLHPHWAEYHLLFQLVV